MDGIVEEERKKGEEGRGSFLHHGSRTGKGREERNCRGGNGDPLRHSIFSWPFLLRREPPFSYQKIREALSLSFSCSLVLSSSRFDELDAKEVLGCLARILRSMGKREGYIVSTVRKDTV